jgi:hypothetical protein
VGGLLDQLEEVVAGTVGQGQARKVELAVIEPHGQVERLHRARWDHG